MLILMNPELLKRTLPSGGDIDERLRRQMDAIRPDAPSSAAPLDEMRKVHANPLGPHSVRKSGDAFPSVLSNADRAYADSRALIASAHPLGAGVPRPDVKVELGDFARGEAARAEVVRKSISHGLITTWHPGEGRHEPRYADGTPVEKRAVELSVDETFAQVKKNLAEAIKPVSDLTKSFRARQALVRECTDADHDPSNLE